MIFHKTPFVISCFEAKIEKYNLFTESYKKFSF